MFPVYIPLNKLVHTCSHRLCFPPFFAQSTPFALLAELRHLPVAREVLTAKVVSSPMESPGFHMEIHPRKTWSFTASSLLHMITTKWGYADIYISCPTFYSSYSNCNLVPGEESCRPSIVLHRHTHRHRYIYIYIYTHVSHTHTHTDTDTYASASIHTHTHRHTHTFTHTYAYAYTHVYTST